MGNENPDKTKKINEDLANQVYDLEQKLKEKDDKIVELAESVAKTQAPPKRVKINLPYSNKYTPTQIKAFKKNGIPTENLNTEPDPEESEIIA